MHENVTAALCSTMGSNLNTPEENIHQKTESRLPRGQSFLPYAALFDIAFSCSKAVKIYVLKQKKFKIREAPVVINYSRNLVLICKIVCLRFCRSVVLGAKTRNIFSGSGFRFWGSLLGFLGLKAVSAIPPMFGPKISFFFFVSDGPSFDQALMIHVLLRKTISPVFCVTSLLVVVGVVGSTYWTNIDPAKTPNSTKS